MKRKMLLIVMLAGVVLFLNGCSCNSWVSFWGGDPAEECADHWKWDGKKPVVASLPCAAPRVVKVGEGVAVGGPRGGAISLVKLAPSEVILNEPFEYKLKVENLTDRELLNVVVTDVKPDLFRFNSSEAEMKIEEGRVSWKLGAIGPFRSKLIIVNAVAVEPGTITSCAEVTYDTPICAKIVIVEPQLRLVKIAPAQSLKCDRIPLKYVISNEGSGHACDITIKDELFEGLLTAEGEREVLFKIDALGPGESREFEIMVDASKTGTFNSRAVAIAKAGGSVESNWTETVVTQPMLAIEQSGPQRQYLGHNITYEITVSNQGDAVARDLIVVSSVPEGIRFKSATEGGNFTQMSPGKVTWNLGQLGPGESKVITMVLSGDQAGSLETVSVAKAFCADDVSISTMTKISGVSAILLEVIDIADPIEVGNEESYVITVTNQGSAADTNIQIVCELEPNMQYVSSSGPTKAAVVGGKITFAPLARLEAGAQVKWRVTVKAIGVGDMRFRTMIRTDQLERPVQESESTMFYK